MESFKNLIGYQPKPEESFQYFSEAEWTATQSQRTMTKKGRGSKTAYGGIPLHCDGKNRGVHDFHIKVVKKDDYGFLTIGIDSGRLNRNCDFSVERLCHYALNSDGNFYERGPFCFPYFL